MAPTRRKSAFSTHIIRDTQAHCRWTETYSGTPRKVDIEKKSKGQKAFVHRYAFKQERKALKEGAHRQVSGSEFQSCVVEKNQEKQFQWSSRSP